jgi:adenylyl- and sulfurtransferase ThiI
LIASSRSELQHCSIITLELERGIKKQKIYTIIESPLLSKPKQKIIQMLKRIDIEEMSTLNS